MAAEGFAVIDVETTGFSPRRGDRILELAIVHVSPDGEIEGRWDTLVNPMRDVGATHIHGITASGVAYAPQFSPSLRVDPRPTGVRKLVGTADAWRLRAGDYRVLYEVIDERVLVTVFKVGHRRDVYDAR